MTARLRHGRTVRVGFTLIELLVVFAIIAILLALLVTAVQRVRSAAAVVECANNLKQLALAGHHYHDVYHSFPPGLSYGNKGPALAPESYNYMSWLVFLLPHVEQGPLWEKTLAAYQANSINRIDPPHIGNSTVVAVFGCPADIYARSTQSDPNFVPGYQISLTSYVGISGLDFENWTGVLYRNSYTRLTDVSDGTSNTLLIGERPPVYNGVWYGHWYSDWGMDFSGAAGVVMGVREKNLLAVTVGSCAPGYYSFEPGNFGNPCDLFHFWSAHSGGANFAFCDGTVRFLRYAAAPIMPALASRAGGETVELPD